MQSVFTEQYGCIAMRKRNYVKLTHPNRVPLLPLILMLQHKYFDERLVRVHTREVYTWPVYIHRQMFLITLSLLQTRCYKKQLPIARFTYWFRCRDSPPLSDLAFPHALALEN